MKPHEIEGNQAHQQQVEIVLYLDPGLFWFNYQRHDGEARHIASSGKIRLCQ